MSHPALAGLRVVDLTHYRAGPYCTKLLAGFGAEVIKIERPGRGDPLRTTGPFYRDKSSVEHSIPFLWLNTGKQSITLDLKSATGHTVVRRLLEQADVLVENFAPGVMARQGLDPDELRHTYPQLVIAAISNFGQTGPYRDYQADELQLNALSGLMSNTGSPARAPLTSGPALTQYTAGLHAYAAILMALYRRGQGGGGEGAYVDVSILESAIEQVENRVAGYLCTGQLAKRGGHAFAPWGLYACADGYATVIGAPFRHWTQGLEVFEALPLAAPRYHHVRDRVQYRAEIDALIQPWLSKTGKYDVFHVGQSRGLSFGYLADLEEVLTCPQHRERGFFAEVDHPETGSHPYSDAPFKLSRTPWRTTRAPLLGEHNQAVYGERLGYSASTLERWREEEII